MDSNFSVYCPVASYCKHMKVLSSIVGEKYLPKTRNFHFLFKDSGPWRYGVQNTL